MKPHGYTQGAASPSSPVAKKKRPSFLVRLPGRKRFYAAVTILLQLCAPRFRREGDSLSALAIPFPFNRQAGRDLAGFVEAVQALEHADAAHAEEARGHDEITPRAAQQEAPEGEDGTERERHNPKARLARGAATHRHHVPRGAAPLAVEEQGSRR